MNSAEEPGRRQEIQSNLKSIVETSEEWLGRLRRRELRVRLASSFLTACLVFLAAGIAFLVVAVIYFGAFGGLSNFFRQSSLDSVIASSIFLVGVISGFATYFLLRRKHEARLKELSSLIIEMKKIDQEQAENGEAITENALYLADKIMTLLPELVRKRNQDSILFGAVALILADVIGNNFPVAILVGVLVWLYFRYETRKTYEREISKFEEQKRVFDQRKQDFMETMETL
ncbi:MAG: hypothetical protein ACHQ03_12085 [Candidatus Bathyarchaeia archaeon]